jgi:hypothetical protein
MSNSASISAAKKRRGGLPPPMGNGGGPGPGQAMSLPPGLPPNFRQLPPHIQQQLFQQLQQRAMAAAAAKIVPPPPQGPPMQPMPPAPMQTRAATPGVGNTTVNVPGPYTVNTVIHNRAMAEVDGIRLRELPISAAGLPCLPSGAALPPNILFKLHHDELLNMDAVLNEHSNKIQMLSNRIDRGVGGAVNNANNISADSGNKPSERNDFSYDKFINNSEFITKILDNILTNTNLSDIINQIEPLQKENESLRSLLNSQQTALNELSGLVMKILSNGIHTYIGEGPSRGHGHDNGHVSSSNNSNISNNSNGVYDSGEGVVQYNEQDNIESNYVFSQVDGVEVVHGDGGNLEEVVKCLEVIDEEDEGGEEDEEDEGDEGDEKDEGDEGDGDGIEA